MSVDLAAGPDHLHESRCISFEQLRRERVDLIKFRGAKLGRDLISVREISNGQPGRP